MRAIDNVISYRGLTMSLLTVNMPHRDISVMCCPSMTGPNEYDEVGRFYGRQPPTDVELGVMCYSREHSRLVSEVIRQWNLGCPLDFVTLGPGFVCAYCGQYNASGRMSCYACGGEVERVPFIKPVQWPTAYLSSWECDDLLHSYDESPLYIEFTLSADGLGSEHIIPLLESRTLDTFQNGFSLTGYRLCEFCGSAVDDDKPCPLCGGYQLPYSELVKIDRDCLYCGRHVENGLCCKGCGAKLSGITFKSINMLNSQTLGI